MKVGVVFFHKNIENIYELRWIKKSIESIFNQTYKDFKCYEVDYGNTNKSYVKDYTTNLDFYSTELNNHAEALNFIFDKAFDDGCDVIFECHMDDYYHQDRFEKQLKYMDKYDVVSSDFCYIEDMNGTDVITTYLNICKYGDIKENLNNNHNMIAHPSVCISKRFWTNDNRFNPSTIPAEDMDLWKRAINNKYNFYIINEVLLFYRIHKNQTSKTNG